MPLTKARNGKATKARELRFSAETIVEDYGHLVPNLHPDVTEARDLLDRLRKDLGDTQAKHDRIKAEVDAAEREADGLEALARLGLTKGGDGKAKESRKRHQRAAAELPDVERELKVAKNAVLMAEERLTQASERARQKITAEVKAQLDAKVEKAAAAVEAAQAAMWEVFEIAEPARLRGVLPSSDIPVWGRCMPAHSINGQPNRGESQNWLNAIRADGWLNGGGK